MYTFALFIFVVVVIYFYPQYNEVCECHGCTQCVKHTCVDYRRGEACNHSEVAEDLKLYYARYYGVEIKVSTMLCHDDHVATRLLLTRSPVSPTTKNTYETRYRGLNERIDRCDHQTWAYGKVYKP